MGFGVTLLRERKITNLKGSGGYVVGWIIMLEWRAFYSAQTPGGHLIVYRNPPAEFELGIGGLMPEPACLGTRDLSIFSKAIIK
jgi:hypothetical protein